MYLTEDPITCFAEKMFYFQREVLTALDGLHRPHSPGIPPFSKTFVTRPALGQLQNLVHALGHVLEVRLVALVDLGRRPAVVADLA